MAKNDRSDLAAALLAKGKIKIQTAADDTYKTGAIVDRTADGFAQSALAFANVVFTTASGATGATQTVTLVVEHGDNSALSDATTLSSSAQVYTWAADGANDGLHCLAVDLTSAKRYIRAKVKVTKGGTVTISAQSVSGGLVLGGLDTTPDGSYVAAGYKTTTEP